MRSCVLATALMFACGPDAPVGTEGGSTTSSPTSEAITTPTTGTSSSSSSSSSSSTGTSTTTAGSDDGLEQYGPCTGDDDCFDGLCIQSEGAAICGPQCPEYGPGPAAGRCPEGAVQSQTICSWTDQVPGACLIMCEDAAGCPDPGMVCVTCPEPFLSACENLWYFTIGKGPNICAWPGA